MLQARICTLSRTSSIPNCDSTLGRTKYHDLAAHYPEQRETLYPQTLGELDLGDASRSRMELRASWQSPAYVLAAACHVASIAARLPPPPIGNARNAARVHHHHSHRIRAKGTLPSAPASPRSRTRPQPDIDSAHAQRRRKTPTMHPAVAQHASPSGHCAQPCGRRGSSRSVSRSRSSTYSCSPWQGGLRSRRPDGATLTTGG